jgi:hypothetical protein
VADPNHAPLYPIRSRRTKTDQRAARALRPLGHSTKAGNGRLRWLLVEAAWQLLRSRSAETAALRAWSLPIARRRARAIP